MAIPDGWEGCWIVRLLNYYKPSGNAVQHRLSQAPQQKGTGVIPFLEPPPPCVTAVSRILSGRVPPARTAISLREPKIPARLATGATIPGVPPDQWSDCEAGGLFPCSVLHRMGFIMPRRLLSGRWALTPPFHPYRDLAIAAVCSLRHFPSKGTYAPSSRVFYAACCRVVSGLSSRVSSSGRPPPQR